MSKEQKNQLKITISGYDVFTTEEATRLVVERILKFGLTFNKLKPVPIRFPTEKEVVTVLKSPHKHKDSQEQFERRTHRRKIFISNVSQVDLKKLEKELRIPNTVHLAFNFS